MVEPHTSVDQNLIHVAVAVIKDEGGRILLSRRPEHTHQGGCWEFPGGKVEPGETLSQALQREIKEELGLSVQAHRPLIRLPHHYADRSVLLDVHWVTRYSGVAEGLEGQPLAWAQPDQLSDYHLLPADKPIVTALRLPDCYLITGQDPTNRENFLARLNLALEDGIRLVQLRAKLLSRSELGSLAKACQALCKRYGADLLLNGGVDLAEEIAADGVHLTSHQLMSLKERPSSMKWVGASCHDLGELQQAQRVGVDFVVLSPVLPTSSHPGASPLGWAEFQALVEQSALPVFALGGMERGHMETAWQNGAQGLAGIRGFWT